MIRHTTPTVFYQDSINFTNAACAQYSFGFLNGMVKATMIDLTEAFR